MYFLKFLPKIKEESIFKSYFIFAFSTIILATCAVCYIIIGEEREHSEQEIRRMQSATVNQKKELIKSEVKRVKEYIDIERQNALKEAKARVEEQTENAYKIIESEYKISKYDKNKLKQSIEKLDFFEGRGYVFVIRMKDGVWDILPADTKKEGMSAHTTMKTKTAKYRLPHSNNR